MSLSRNPFDRRGHRQLWRSIVAFRRSGGPFPDKHPAVALDLRSRKITSGTSPVRAILALGLPILVGAVSALMSGVIDTVMIGHYGADDLVAVAGATTIFDVFANVVLASAVGHQILAARFAGRQEPAGVWQSLRASAWFCGALAVLATVLCCSAGGSLSGLVLGRAGHLRHIAAGFLLACGPSLLLLVPFTLLTATFNAYKRPRFAMVAAIAVNLVNLGLDRLLIYGAGPVPQLGAVGSGVATTISWAAGVGCMAIAAYRFRLLRLLRQAAPGPDVPFTTSIPQLAWPAIVSQGLDYASVAIFFAIIGGLGEASLGGGRIAFQLMVVVYGIFGAFGAAGRVLVGRAAGAGDLAGAYGLWRAAQQALVFLGVPVALLMISAPRLLASLFTSFPHVLAAAGPAIRVVGVCLPLMAWTLGGVSTMRAFGHTRWDMYGNLLSALFVQLPVGWLLAHVAGLGVSGAFLGVVSYWAARGTASEILARRALSRERSAPASARLRQQPAADPARP
jgi:multidrug resistance protein, MATE family